MKIIKIIFVLVLSVFSLLILWFYISNAFVLPWQKQEIIAKTLEWGGLNELPKGVQILNIDKKGSTFTRQYIIDFKANNTNEIKEWINKSKRLKNNIPRLKANSKLYEIIPGENGSFGGNVKIQGELVRINMSWS